MKIGIIYGTTTGRTEDAAEAIAENFGDNVAEYADIETTSIAQLTGFDVLILGCPTWDIGELQNDWYLAVDKVEGQDVRFDGTRVAFFGDGDQGGYPENFQDALGVLRELFVGYGAIADIGRWPVDGYEFSESRAVVDGKFVGLALDDLNQNELSEERITRWCAQLKREIGIASVGAGSGRVSAGLVEEGRQHEE